MQAEKAALRGKERLLPGTAAPAGQGEARWDGRAASVSGGGIPGRMSLLQAAEK